jgi:hypothetical protein
MSADGAVCWLRKTIEGDKLSGCMRSSPFIASGNP